MQPDKSTKVERFHPTQGRILGLVTLAIVALIAVLAVVDREGGLGDVSWWLVVLMVALGTLAWGSMLRPGLAIDGDELVMRNMFETVRLPLAGIEEVAARQVLVVRIGEKKFVSSAIGRNRRELSGRARPVRDAFTNVAMPSSLPGASAEESYAVLVERRLRAAAKDARDRRGIAIRSREQAALAADVVRAPAWIEIGLLSASALAFVLLLALN